MPERKKKKKEKNTSKNFANIVDSLLNDILSVLKNRQCWINGLIGALLYIPTTLFAEQWGITYLRHVHHLSTLDASTMTSAIFVGWAVGSPLMSFLSEYLKKRAIPLIIGSAGAALSATLALYDVNLSTHMLYFLFFFVWPFFKCRNFSLCNRT